MDAPSLQEGSLPAAPAALSSRRAQEIPRPKRVWNDAPLRSKALAYAALAALGGAAIGMLEAASGYHHWVLLAGLGIWLLVLAGLGRYLLWRPLELLCAAWDRLNLNRAPGSLQTLPITRRDEVGHLARAIHQLTGTAIRENYQARTLRRTLDSRIAHATRTASQRLLRLAMRDPLTDLGNRRLLEESLGPLINSVLASGASLAAIVLDCDNFKLVNDKLGHATGDELLVSLAGLIRASIRQSDYAVRLGGDEFLILIPDCTHTRIEMFTERLRRFFQQQAQAITRHSIPVDLSIGVAYLPGLGVRTGKELLDRADEALYAAKHAGKGRTVGA